MADIQYNFANNYSSLDDIGKGVNQVSEAQGDVMNVVNLLHDIFDGQTAQQAQHLFTEINRKMDDLAGKMAQTNAMAVQHQHDMQALDNHHAAQLGG